MGTQVAVSEHDTKILSILREQRTKGLFTDVKIVSANAVFWAHACILAPFSSLVSKVFYSKNPEGNEEKWSTQSPCILKFPNGYDSPAEVDTCNRKFCEECIQKVIDFIYNGQITIDKSHAEHVRFIVRFLEIENFPLTFESILKRKHSCEDEASSFQLTPSPQMKESHSNQSSFHQDCDPLGKKSEMKFEPKQAIRTDFENILSKTNSLASENQLSATPTDGSNNQQRNPSTSEEKLSCNNTYEIEDCNIICESSIKRKKPAPAVEIQSKFENPTAMEEKLLKKGKLNSSDLICLFCPFESSSILDLLNHKLNLGHKKDTNCFLCSSSFSTNQELQTHLKEHLEFDYDAFINDESEVGSKSYKCGQCNKEFRWRQCFQRHLSVHDAPHKKCSKCDFVANTNYAMKYHEKKMHSDSFYSCYHENCSFKTKRKGNLKNHILSVHKKTRLCCPNCDKTFSQKKNLQRHVNLYHNTLTTIHQCSMCTYVTHRADNLQKHKASMHSNVKSNACIQSMEDNKIIPEKFENNSSAVNINFISLKNNEGECTSAFTQKPLDTDNLYSGDLYTNIANGNNPNFAAPMVNVSGSDFSIKSPSFSARNGRQIASLCCNGFPENSSSFSVLHTENKRQNVDDQVPQIISIPHIDCKMTGTLSFNETAGTLTYHNLNSESTGALILNEITGELTYIKLVPQQSPVANIQHEPNYSSFPCVDYSDLPCEMNFSQVTNNNTNNLILNESTGELDLINQTKEQDAFDWNDRLPGKGEDEYPFLFDAVDEEEEENDLLDIDPADFMNESNSNSEIPVLNEWTGEINLLPNNFLGGPFLDEQTGQLSVFDLFDNDLIFDCLDEPAPSNTILNENTGEILNNSMNEDNYPTNIGNDYRPKDTFGEAHGDCPLFCDDLTLDNDLEYSLNEATGQLSIEWPEVSEDSNFSFLLNELTGELSVKGING